MSLITRCPACQTSFKVVPDQLRISDGWVRCGQCQQIFDANAALVDEAHQALSSQNQTPQNPDGLVAKAVQVAQASSVPEPALTQVPVEPRVDLSLAFGAVDPPPHLLPHPTPAVTPATAALAQPAASLSVETPHEALVKAAVQDVSFMRSMPEKSSWQRASVRVVLCLAALGLAVALGVQVALQEKDRLAALFPQAKPALNWLCGQLNCSVGNLRQIESVVIDSSSFNKIRTDMYRLALAVRNTSALDIAMPALELTLTDSQDQAVVRRVLLANEFSSSSTLAAASDWTGAIAINVHSNGAAERFSGYRVLAFYP